MNSPLVNFAVICWLSMTTTNLPLGFYRVKASGDNDAFLEFNEPQADMSPSFRKKNPNVKVVFISVDNVEWNDAGTIGGPVNVGVD